MSAENITAYSTVVLAAITLAYAEITRRILSESAKMRRATEDQARAASDTLKHLQKQVENERDDLLKQEANQRKEVAVALTFEIVGFYHHHISHLISSAETAAKNLPQQQPRTIPIVLKSPPTTPFPVYSSNASRIGEFRREEIEPLLSFYNDAESFLSALRDVIETKKITAGQSGPATVYLENESSKRLFTAVLETRKFAVKACTALAGRAGISFNGDSVKVVG